MSYSPQDPEQTLSVSELTDAITALLEQGIGHVCVEGEISNWRRQSSGHCYFSIKDERAQLSAVIFHGAASRLSFSPSDGMLVKASGSVTVYKARGQYQLIVSRLQPAGLGDLQRRFEELKNKLRAEGLFDSSRKRPIPKFPQTAVLVTSPSGAALRDMLTVLERRAPQLRLRIFPVRVQGDGAAAEIASALATISRWSQTGAYQPLDTVILARGGGSIEDLWAFNEEPVARAIAACSVPVISGIGHETDFTIADFVADLRAPTPSAAAELLIQNREDLLDDIASTTNRLAAQVQNILMRHRLTLDRTTSSAVFRDPARIVQAYQQRVDDLTSSLDQSLDHRLSSLALRLDALTRSLAAQHPSSHLALLSSKLQTACARLELLDPTHTVRRGYAILKDTTGHLIRSTHQLPQGTKFHAVLSDGTLHAISDGTEP